jgi:hypothetical protein
VTVPRDERFVFDSDTEEDVKNAVLLPPMVLKPLPQIEGTYVREGPRQQKRPTGNGRRKAAKLAKLERA